MRSALILAGGRGERFWPWSRPGLPKQLLPLADGKVLLLATLERLAGIVPPETTWIMTGKDLAPRIAQMVGDRARVVEEPIGRNTAPAIGYAALLSDAAGATDGMAVLPADHLIADLPAFQADLERALALAESGDRLVTFGIPPAGPETGYGYLERGEALGPERAFKVQAFKEKPDLKTAQAYATSGKHFVNSGIFAWKPSAILAALDLHRPALGKGVHALTPAAKAFVAGKPAALGAALEDVFPALESVSIDYAVMEKARNAVMIEAAFDWDDLGSWTAWARHQVRDSRGNVTSGRAVTIDSDDCVVLGGGKQPVVVLGGKGLIVIEHEGGTLVCPLERADEVRKAVKELEERGWLEGEGTR
jgi:mannose-1-phosphate guanylyltransferase